MIAYLLVSVKAPGAPRPAKMGEMAGWSDSPQDWEQEGDSTVNKATSNLTN
jgi:hypothetical protein